MNVYVWIYGKCDSAFKLLDVYLWDGASYVYIDTTNMASVIGWHVVDASSTITNITKLNSTRLKLVLNGSGGNYIYIYKVKLVVGNIERYVDGYVDDYKDVGMEFVGSSPYLGDNITSYIKTDDATQEIRYFTFSDSPYMGGPYVTIGTINPYLIIPDEVLLQIDAACGDMPYVNPAHVECYLWVSGSWVDAGEMIFTDFWNAFQTLNVTSILNTTIKINATRLKLVINTDGVHYTLIYKARIVVDGKVLWCNSFTNDVMDAGVSTWGNYPYLQDTFTDCIVGQTNVSMTCSYFEFEKTNTAIPIGPLNIPYSRVSDALDLVLNEMFVAYVPYEWWIDYTGALQVAEFRGSDKTATVTFEAGIHIGRSTKASSSTQSSQRVRVIGRGESADQDAVTSAWASNPTEMANVGTFYEYIDSEKELDLKVKTDDWANILLLQNAPLKQDITIVLENDTYTVNDFDVGDIVTVTDSDAGLSGSYRIKTISKRVDGNGETTTVTLSNVRTDISDRLANFAKQLEKLMHSSTYLDILYAGGGNQRKLNVDKMEDIWEQTASNKFAIELAEDETDYDTENGLEYCKATMGGTDISYECSKDEFGVWGAADNVDGNVFLKEPLVKLSRNPRFICEFEIDTTDHSSEDWADYCLAYIRMRERSGVCVGGPNDTKYCCAPYNDIQFGFKIYHEDGEYHLYAVLNDVEGSVGGSGNPAGVKIANISKDIKYTIEARVDWKAKTVKYYFGKTDVEEEDDDWILLGLRLRAVLSLTRTIQDTATDTDNLLPFEVMLQDGSTTTKMGIVIYRYTAQALKSPQTKKTVGGR